MMILPNNIVGWFITNVLIFFVIIPPYSATFPTLFESVCLDEAGHYNAHGAYHNNLNVVFHNLTDQAALTKFGNYSSGEGSNKVYGLYNCRGDLTFLECLDCVNVAFEAITKQCLTQKEAIIYYEECTLRYANRTIFALQEEEPSRRFSYNNVMYPTNSVKGVRDKIMDRLIKKAAYDNSTDGYAVGDGYLPETDHQLYCLVQCTPDILGSLCDKCLRSALKKVIYHTAIVMVFYPSCNLRTDVKPFSTNTTVHIPSPAWPRAEIVKVAVSVAAAAVVLVLLVSGSCWFYRRKRKSKQMTNSQVTEELPKDLNELSAPDSVQFDLDEIIAATNNFASNNKLGEGGFGSVYKGTLRNGQEIAVKRLSTYSGQGFKEFKTEVLLVVKLQHKNLVRLLGFCVEKEEKLLVYEFLPNSSLDKLLFDPDRCSFLDWQTRYNIILGVARGLTYLHEDSRLTIVHRDLKCSNILLDHAMNPKIADFGLARLFGEDQIYASTKIIVGTYGYMAPEYALHGHFSTKSDVYSFGMMVLEILSGQRSTYNNLLEPGKSLLHRAWMCWTANQPLSIVDVSLNNNFSEEEVIKCVHIGLLCIQEEVMRRPSMSMIVNVMNGNSTINLLEPTPPLITQTIGLQVNNPSSLPLGNPEISDSGSSSQVEVKFSGPKEISDLLPR